MTTFSDDFNRADSTNLGANWVEVSGDWSIVSNQLSPGAAGGTIILRAAGAMATNDNYAQATIAATTAASHGVWCRGNSNITSGYLWRNDGSSWDLFSVVGGSFSVIGSYAAAAAPGDVAKVQAVGSTIKAFVNGVQRVSVTDTGVTSGTSVGIRSESTSSIKFDDFTGADVSAGATLGTATETSTAQAFTRAKSATLAPASEQNTARALTGTKAATLGRATAIETARALASAKTTALIPATEVETARPLTGAKTVTLGPATETSTARPLTRSKHALLSPAVETSTARPLAATKTAVLTPAGTVEEARRLAVPYRLVPAQETCTARALTIIGQVQRPADRLDASTSGPVLAASSSGPQLAATSTTGG